MTRCLVCLLILYIAFSLGCSDSQKEQTSSVFHYNQHNPITSLDPAYARSQNNIWAVNHLFSTLIRLDDSLNTVPSIAKSWNISDDGLIYTFQLRDDVFFHQNPCFQNEEERQLRADDVVYSFYRLIDTTINAPGSWIFSGRVSKENPFVALDDLTFQLTLAQPFAPLLSLLTMQYTSIIPEEAVDYYGSNFFQNPVGSGPFQFKKWLDNQGLFLIRNDDFFGWNEGYSANISGIRTSFIGERSIAFLELVNGRIDFFSGLESSFINTALEANGSLRAPFQDRIQFIKSPYLNFEYMGIYPGAPNAHPLLSQVAFRKALNMGIDRSLMLSSLRNNIGIPADAGVITKGLPSYDPSIVRGYFFNPDSARQLLRSFDSELLSEPLIIQTSKDYLDLTTFIAKQWENLGLTISIEVLESATLRNAMRSGEAAMFRASWIADYPDGESFLSMFYSGNPAPPNYTRYSNPDFDSLYQQALNTSEPTEKISLYQEMDRMIIEDAPVVFLFYDEIALFARQNLNGISRNALNLLQADHLQK